MLGLRRLEMLRRFAVLGSITATAADLGYSPSAISQQLATLEREAGVALIERTAHSATLTDAGRELAEHAGIVLAAVETAGSRMRARATTVGGHVEVSCIPGLAAALAPDLAAVQNRHSALSVVARETDSSRAAVSVLEGRCDLAVVDDWSEHPAPPTFGLTVHELRSEPVVLAVPAGHPRAQRSAAITVSALREVIDGQTWLCAPTGQLSRTAGDHRLETLGITPNRRWEFQGLHVLAALVSTGAGVAFLPASLVTDQPGLTGLVLRPRMHRRVIALTRSSRQQDPALATCLAAAQHALGRRPSPTRSGIGQSAPPGDRR
jgi:DNA-binding transcriptional LysR family regulator